MESTVLPIPIRIGRIVYASVIQAFHHTVKFSLPQLFEPRGLSKPPDKFWADGVVGADERPAVPSSGKGIVPVPTQRPHRRAVIRAVHAGGNIAAGCRR